MRASKTQLALLNIHKQPQPLIAIVGAIRNGKTLFAGMFGFCELIIHQMKHSQGMVNYNRFAVLSQTSVDTLYKNVLSNMIVYLKMRGFSIDKHPKIHTYTCTRDDMAFTLEGFSSTNTHAYKSFRGSTFRSVFIDEAPLLDHATIQEAQARTLSFPDAKLVMTGNPEGTKNHWFYRNYLANNPQVHYRHFTVFDNPTITQETVDKFRATMTEAEFNRKILGLWVGNDNQCYSNMLKHTTTVPQYFECITFGMDYGEDDATTVICLGYSQYHDQYFILDQWYHKNGQDNGKYTLIEYKKQISQWVNALVHQYEAKRYEMYIDPQPMTTYTYFCSDDEIDRVVNIRKVNKRKLESVHKDQITARVLIVNAMLGLDKLLCVQPELPIYGALDGAVYKNGSRLDDGTSDIDSLDALEYALYPDFDSIINSMDML